MAEDEKLADLWRMLTAARRAGGPAGGPGPAPGGGAGGAGGPPAADDDDQPHPNPQGNQKPPKPELIRIAKKGKLEELRDYIAKHPDEINKVNPFYGTALHRAVMTRGYDKVRLLLQAGADPNLWARPIHPDSPPRDFPPLFTALAGQDVILLRQLARAGVDLNMRGPGERHPLHHAVLVARDSEAADPIIIVQEYFHLAKERNVLIDVNASAESVYGKTALHLAVGAGFTATVHLLISNGANLDAVDLDGWSALHVAVAKDNAAMCRLLLFSGASMDIRSTDKNNYLPSEMETSDRHVRTSFMMARTARAYERQYLDDKTKEL